MLCLVVALAVCVFLMNLCLERAFNVYYAKVDLAKAVLNACLVGCGVVIITFEA